MKHAARKPRAAEPPLLPILGWKEYVEFPEWNIGPVKAKIDTGARTSAVHVDDFALYDDPKRGTMAELHLALDRRRPWRFTIVHAPVLRMVTVTSSGGQRETRPLVSTPIRLGPIRKHVLLTVTNRATMLFRVLLGRKAIEGSFLVDVRKKYQMKQPGTQGRKKKRKTNTSD